MTILKPILSNNKIIDFGIYNLDYIRESPNEHTALAESLSKGNNIFESVLISVESLNEALYDNPRFNKIETIILVSEIEKEAREQCNNQYLSDEQIEKIILDKEIILRAGNYTTKEENHRHKCAMTDHIYEAQLKSLYPEIIDMKKEQFKYSYDELDYELTDKIENAYYDMQQLDETEFDFANAKDYLLSLVLELEDTDFYFDMNDGQIIRKPEAVEREWPNELLRLLTPSTIQRNNRIYDMQKPFDHWDHRNPWQQYFFVKNLDTGVVYYTRGGSGSSGARETQGLMAHTFVTLSKKFKIPTHICKYNKYNEFIYVNKHDTLKVINQELSGNYRVKLDKSIFDGFLLNFDYDTRDFN